MALDFDLQLIMPEDSMAIFSRGALQMTVKLIKSKAPELAADVLAILNQTPLPTGNEPQNSNLHQHMFHVQLPSEKVSAIVQVIQGISKNSQNNLLPGMAVVAKALFKDWQDLAQVD